MIPLILTLSWTAIAYTGNTGGYEIWYSTTNEEGSYSLLDTTADKTVETAVYDLSPDIYYFRLRTFTGPHSRNQNTVYSEYTNPVNTACAIPPDISISVSPDTLWPPNHAMFLITPYITVTDNCGCASDVVLTSITMNEGDIANTYDPLFDSTESDGDTSDDIQIIDGDIYLRAERAGSNNNGRIYTITYTATDCFGNAASASATVTVPHNQ